MRMPTICKSPGHVSVCRGALMLAIAGLAACATHRSDPPKCKGAFTPINQSVAAVNYGSQR
jgi:hypothetical protein